MKEHKVYHIHFVNDHDLKHGYIGVTSDLPRRLRSHRHSGLFKPYHRFTVLCVGSEEYCYEVERLLRPVDGIGSNKSHGGKVNTTCYKEGDHPSPETEIKPGQRLSVKTQFKKGNIPHNKGNGLKYIFTDPKGNEYFVECITDFCKANDLTPQNMRKVAKGQRNFHKGWKAIRAGR